MLDKFVVKRNLVSSYIVTKDGEKVGMSFPVSTKFEIIGNTIIADVSKTNKEYNYKVFSYIDDENRKDNKIVSNFDCIEYEKLGNGNLRLKLAADYEGKERSLLFDTVKGKPCSRIYDGMCKVVDGTFLCTYNINKRGYNFNYYFKINENGDVVSNVVNSYTGEKVSYEDLVYDENATIKLINEKANANFVKAHDLPRLK